MAARLTVTSRVSWRDAGEDLRRGRVWCRRGFAEIGGGWPGVTTELVLLGTAGAPLPCPGRAGISSVVIAGERIFVIDCGRGSPSGFAGAGLSFARLEAVLLTHLHADHTADLPGMLLYGWGVRTGQGGPPPPIVVYGPSRPQRLPGGGGAFARRTIIHPELPAPGTADLVGHIVAGYAYHLNVMPLDAQMPDPAQLVRAAEVSLPAAAGAEPVTVLQDDEVTIRAVAVSHGHAVPALAYRFDTADGAIAFSGDTTVSDSLIALAAGADILVHQVADLSYLKRHGVTGDALRLMTGLHTDVSEVGTVAERAGVGELILSHYLPAEPEAISEASWADRARQGFSGITTAGRDGMRRMLPASP
jgi:ribonuclease BN (tRNA processing enzyme)